MLALASICDGGSRRSAAKLGGSRLQIVRDWVLRFNVQGLYGLIDRKAPGQTPKLNAAQRQAVAEKVDHGPIAAVVGVVRWQLKDLVQWIFEEFGISLNETTVGRELKAMGFRKLSARPRHHAQNGEAIEDFKKFPHRTGGGSVRLTGRNLHRAAEARGGQKNKITRRWAKRGTRPVARKDQRTKSAYIFGAICPERGVGAALVLPRCDTQAMQWHLNEIASQVAPGAHAVLMVDQAGWHTTDKLAVPANITILPLPPRSPELNPVENIWQFIRDNWLSNRVFESYDQIITLCCHAWNKLIDQPWKIMSIGLRQWAHGF